MVENIEKRVIESFEQGLDLLRQGDYDAALDAFDHTANITPNKALLCRSLGVFYAKTDEYDKAIEHYDLAIAIEPYDAVAYYYRSVAYTKMGEADKANADYGYAVMLDPDFDSEYHSRVFASDEIMDILASALVSRDMPTQK